jgi:hypothetical protein
MHDDALPEKLFYDLAAQATERMMEELPSEEELSHKLSFTPAFERRMEKLFANPKSARTRDRRAWRILAIAAAILILLTSALMSVSAVREAVFKFFVTLYEKYVVVWFAPEDDTLMAPETILEFREPAYVPPGFEQDSAETSEQFHSVSYLDDEGLFLLFRQTILDSVQYALDIEGAIGKELFEIHGTTAMYRVKNELLEAIWTDNEYSYYLTGQIDVEQALKMAYSVK